MVWGGGSLYFADWMMYWGGFLASKKERVVDEWGEGRTRGHWFDARLEGLLRFRGPNKVHDVSDESEIFMQASRIG